MSGVPAGALAQLRISALTPVSLVTSYLSPVALAIVVISLYGHLTGALVAGTIAAAAWNTLLIQAYMIVNQERAWGTLQQHACTPAGVTPWLVGRLLGALLQALLTIPLIGGLVLATGGAVHLGPWKILLVNGAIICASLIGIAVLHMTLAIRYRWYSALINAIFPLTIVLMGLFARIDRLPAAVGAIGHLFAPTWAMEAIRRSSWSPALTALWMSLLTALGAVAYLTRVQRWLRTSSDAYHR
jgi:hypothetical protein